MDKIQLQKLAGGVVQEKFAKAFERVLENMQDVNTPYKDKRKITITLGFTQNEARDDVKCSIDVSEKLAAHSAFGTAFAVGKNLKTGEIFAQEYGKQIAGQIGMEEAIPDCDPDTGEVYEEVGVIDFRKVSEA